MEEDYPQTLLEFETRFSTEEACWQYLIQLRWPEGFICPRCEGRDYWLASRNRLVCRSCRYQASATSGTILQDTRKPLRMWFSAMWFVTSQKTGASAMGMQRALGLGSYMTAWTWLHKLRRGMIRPGRDRLTGRVEVDETYIGGAEEGMHGRQIEGKALVVIAAQEEGRGFGRIRMARIPDASGESLLGFIGQTIEPGSLVRTDGWKGYEGLERLGYSREVVILKGKEKDVALRMLPKTHRIAGLLKRWLLGTHQGAVSPEHLDYYLDEFTFRFNRRKSHSRGKLFFRLVQQIMEVAPSPYKAIVGGKTNPGT